MKPVSWKRRQLLGFSLSALGMMPLGRLTAGVVAAGSGRFLSAASRDLPDGSRQPLLKAFDLAGERLEPAYEIPLPGRAHHIAVSARQGLFIAIARRPGNWLVVGDLSTGEQLQTLRLPEGRHFQGHGIFSPDGRVFRSVESAYEAQGDNGRIGLWSVDRSGPVVLKAAGLDDSHGTGAHELHMMPDGETLVVANGGIRTHPDRDRDKLNLDSMAPSLVYIEASSGRLLEKTGMPADWHRNSIRHLDVNDAGLVAIATQYEGAPFDTVPLVAFHKQGGPLRYPTVPAEVGTRMRQYCGSVRFDASGLYLAVTCPRGNLLTFWDSREERLIRSLRLRDVCGISACDGGFLFTTGTGHVGLYDARQDRSSPLTAATGPESARVLWDNHLSSLEGFS